MSASTGPASGGQSASSAPVATVLAAYHASARAEIIARIERRDLALALYLGAVATIFAVVVVDFSSRAESLLVIPLMGLGASYIYAQHNTVIGGLGLYIAKELDPIARRLFEDGAEIHSWDGSITLKEMRAHIPSRLLSALTLVIVPSVGSTILAWVWVPDLSWPWYVGILVLESALITLTGWNLIRSHLNRQRFRAGIAAAVSGGSPGESDLP